MCRTCIRVIVGGFDVLLVFYAVLLLEFNKQFAARSGDDEIKLNDQTHTYTIKSKTLPLGLHQTIRHNDFFCLAIT